jgi:CheY-like chemotaxis protein
MMKIKHALVVDDSKSARYSLKKLLERQGLEVTLAESAGDALNHLEIKLPDIIFMDHLMPGMDGFEATQVIKANPVTRHLPIVMCTSKEGAEYAEQAKARGAIAILPKPAPVEALLAVFDNIQSLETEPVVSVEETSEVATLDVKQRVLENLVKDIVEEQLESIRVSVDSTVTQRVESQINEAMMSLKADLFAEIFSGLRSQMDSEIAAQTLDKVDTAMDERLSSLKTNLTSELKQDVSLVQKEMQNALDTPSEALLHAIKEITRSESQNIQDEIKEDLHQYIVQSASQSEFDAFRDELKNEVKSGIKTINLAKNMGVIGALLGAAALLMVLLGH